MGRGAIKVWSERAHEDKLCGINESCVASRLDEFGADDSEFLYDLAHVLGVVAMGDEQGVFGVDNDEIFHAQQRHKLLGAVDVIVSSLDRKVAVGFSDIPFAVAAQACLHLVFIQRSPGAEIIPAELGGKAVELGLVFALG